MSLKYLEDQPWYWGTEDKIKVNTVLENCLDGTYLVRQSSTPPDQTIHVVYRGRVTMIKVLVKENSVGLSPDNMTFKSVLELVRHFSQVSLAHQNKSINVRLTNPVHKDVNSFSSGALINDDESSWVIYVNLFMESEILTREEDKLLRDLQAAEVEAQEASYIATSQNMVIDMWKAQLGIRTMSLTHFMNKGQEYDDIIRRNFNEQERRIQAAEATLEEVSHIVTQKQNELRAFHMKKDAYEKRKRVFYRTMDWFERILTVEGIDNELIVKMIEPFSQQLGTKLLVNGIKEMWFTGQMDHTAANKLLNNHGNGTYLVRLNRRDEYMLCVVNKNITRHIKVHQDNNLYWLKSSKRFRSVEDLVTYFQNHSLGLQDRDYETKLIYPVYSV